MKTVTVLPRVQVVLVIVSLFPCLCSATRIACVGDSNTFGMGLDRSDAYPAQLEGILRQYDLRCDVGNFGFNGATVLHSGDLSYRNLNVYSQALAYEPDIVIFCFGGNASRSPNRGYIQDHYVSNYMNLIDRFANLQSAPELLIGLPLPVRSENWTLNNEIIVNDVIPRIKQVASEKGIPIIDFHAVFKDASHLYQSDAVHPTAEGAGLMAEMVAAYVSGIRMSPDFSGDGVVDSTDMCMMIDHWQTDAPAYDLAPPPFGDGFVDVQDLTALAAYLFTYPGTVAHWPLDETEGDIAYDHAGANDGELVDGPLWRPEDGILDGALAFDGANDYVAVGRVFYPTGDPFSILAWVKGGAPGQVIVSQADGVNWLLLDPADGTLMTELAPPPSRTPVAPLVSESVITDGDWHRIGFVWDGSTRALYVDDVLAAEDPQTSVATSHGDLHIGCGADQEQETFYSGLVDDVRIYNRAVRP